MAAPLLGLGLGLQAGASLIEGFVGSKQKKNEAAILRYDAELARQSAEQKKLQTRFKLSRQATEGARTLGMLEASIGGSGLVGSLGAPLMALALQESENELENFLIGWQGKAEEEQLLSQADQYDLAASQAKKGANQALLGGFLSAGATGLAAWSQIPKTTTPPDLAKTTYAYQSYRPFSGYGGK